jgi:protein involved in polysaccharide export with SLBB domain
VLRTVSPYILFLSIVLIGNAGAQNTGAQSDRSAMPSDRPASGIQITNIPGEQGQSRDRQLTEEKGQRDQARDDHRISQGTVRVSQEPDLEFQAFVTSSLGYRLEIFGQNLFQNVPSTFAPLDLVPVGPDYVIGPGDELFIRAWGQIDINYRAVVDRTGSIYLPRIGTIGVASLRYDQLNGAVKSAVGREFKNFELNVTLGQLRSIQVFVVGQVRQPGSYTVSSLSTLVNTLFASGGPSNRGSLRHIQLKRGGKDVTEFDLYALIVRGDKTKDAQLLPGDVIYVPPVGPLVALAGSVSVPGIFELKDHDSLADVIKYAGGITTTAARRRAILERIDEDQGRRAEEFPLTPEGLKREVRDGDIVRFLHIPLKFENAITIRGNVAVPGRYPWRDGMRVKDLIPDRDFLVTDEYWKRQNRLGLNPSGEGFELKEGSEQTQQTQQTQLSLERTRPSSNGSGQRPQDLASSPPEDQNRENGQTGLSHNEPLGKRVSKTEAQRITEEQFKNEIKRSAAEINWEYAVVQRLNLEDLTTHLVPFNLGRAIAGDDTQNLTLRPGDVITIFSQADMQVPIAQQSKFVRLEGEFRAAGVYQAEPGETLRHLIARVGGLTREDQQQRLDQYINDLEKSIERNAGSQRSLSGEEAIAERQSVEGQRRLLDKLRQLKAAGRIVLELKPNANDLGAFPDLVLEDSDRLLVPFRPVTVNVIGSVNSSNSFVFKQGKTYADYLRLAGGATRNGDRGRSFVIRADGSTVSSQGHNGLLLNSFSSMRLMPGDTIVVPEKLDKGVALRGFKDWTQIIGQFVIGAAAAKVLFP